MSRTWTVSVLLLALFAGCSNEQDSRPVVALPPASLPGVYHGIFPCDGCAGIPTTLWLRPDGRFFFRQRYPLEATGSVDDVYSLGRWDWSADEGVVELIGAGPVRAFSRPDRDVLILRTMSGHQHRLNRDPAAPEFTASMRLSGMTQMLGDDVVFTECLTGLEAPIRKGGDFPRFHHQVRSVNRLREPVPVEIEGRFTWADDGAPQSVSIERFITIRDDEAC
jgi:uncharacterized lipoprotein NlpE involved in copper resistance